MKVTKIKDLIRNDCTMELECEHCGHEQDDKYAYNDRYYISTVVPNERYCDNCKKNTAGNERPLPTPIPTEELDKSLDTLERLSKEFKPLK